MFQMKLYEGYISSYVCAGVHFWLFRVQIKRILHIASFIMSKHIKLFPEVWTLVLL